jgi:hypothetical protein
MNAGGSQDNHGIHEKYDGKYRDRDYHGERKDDRVYKGRDRDHRNRTKDTTDYRYKKDYHQNRDNYNDKRNYKYNKYDRDNSEEYRNRIEKSRSRSRNSFRDNHHKKRRFEDKQINQINNEQDKFPYEMNHRIKEMENEKSVSQIRYTSYAPPNDSSVKNIIYNSIMNSNDNQIFVAGSNYLPQISQNNLESFNETNNRSSSVNQNIEPNHHSQNFNNTFIQNNNLEIDNSKNSNFSNTNTQSYTKDFNYNSLSKNIVMEQSNKIISNRIDGKVLSFKTLHTEIKEDQEIPDIINKEFKEVFENISSNNTQEYKCANTVRQSIEHIEQHVESKNEINNPRQIENENSENNLAITVETFKYDDKFKIQINQLLGLLALKNFENKKIISKLYGNANNQLEENLKNNYQTFCEDILNENKDYPEDEDKFMISDKIPVTIVTEESKLRSSILSMNSLNMKYKQIKNEIYIIKKKIVKENNDMIEFKSNIENSVYNNARLTKRQIGIQSKLDEIFSDY